VRHNEILKERGAGKRNEKEELGIGFVPWSPLGVQFLTGWIDANTRFAPGDIRAAESRFSPENLPHNLQLVELLKTWAKRKDATPGQIALAWLNAAISTIEVKGQRLPDAVLAFSGVEAPMKK